jgi:hypothetical protein
MPAQSVYTSVFPFRFREYRLPQLHNADRWPMHGRSGIIEAKGAFSISARSKGGVARWVRPSSPEMAAWHSGRAPCGIVAEDRGARMTLAGVAGQVCGRRSA